MTATQRVLVIANDLDVFSSSKMRDALADLKEPATIDLTRVRHLDAAALGVLAAVARNVGIGKLTIIVPRGSLARLMKMVGFMNLARVIIDRRETFSPGYQLARRRTDRAAHDRALERAGAA
jgi:anti-anti-sigma regulatory factor